MRVLLALLVSRLRLGLDRPAGERYVDWLGFIVTEGDFGRALTSNRPVAKILGPNILNTLVLAGVAFLSLPTAGVNPGDVAGHAS